MNQILSVQVLRALAALSVAYGHAAYDASQIAARSGQTFEPAFRELSAAGVDLFFVISGFVMVWSSRSLFGRPGAAGLFIGRRLARIVPLYWATTTVFLLALAMLPQAVNAAAPAVGDIVKSYVFIPFRRPGDGSLQPVYGLGWTLNYEMFFYVCFAGLLALRAGWAIGVLVAVFSGIVAAGYWLTPQSAPLQFWSQPIILEFVLGALVGYAYLSGVRVPRPVGLAAVALAACFFLAATGGTFPQGAFDRLWMLGAPAALALAGATLVNQSPREGAVWRGLAMLGDASYALYLIHPMLIRALNMVWTKLGLAPQVGWPFILVALLLSLASAVVVYRWFERPLTLWLQGRSRS